MSRPHSADKNRIFAFSTIPTLQALRAQGHTYLAIANQLRVSYSTVYRAVNKIESYAGAAQ